MNTFFSNLFATIKSSFYDREFYVKVRTQTVGSVAKWFVMFAFVGFAALMVPAYSFVYAFANSHFLQTVQDTYPDGLEITLANGTLSVNQPVPYYIKNTFTEKPTYLAIFDTDDVLKGETAVNETFVLVKSGYAIAGTGRDARVTSFSGNVGTSTQTKADVVSFIEKVRPYFKPTLVFGGAFAIAFGIVVASFAWTLFHLLYILVPAVLLFLIARIRKPVLLYGEAYMIACYASIPVAFFSFLSMAVIGQLPPFVYTALVLLVAVVNLTPAHGSTPPVSEQATL